MTCLTKFCCRWKLNFWSHYLNPKQPEFAISPPQTMNLDSDKGSHKLVKRKKKKKKPKKMETTLALISHSSGAKPSTNENLSVNRDTSIARDVVLSEDTTKMVAFPSESQSKLTSIDTARENIQNPVVNNFTKYIDSALDNTDRSPNTNNRERNYKPTKVGRLNRNSDQSFNANIHRLDTKSPQKVLADQFGETRVHDNAFPGSHSHFLESGIEHQNFNNIGYNGNHNDANRQDITEKNFDIQTRVDNASSLLQGYHAQNGDSHNLNTTKPDLRLDHSDREVAHFNDKSHSTFESTVPDLGISRNFEDNSANTHVSKVSKENWQLNHDLKQLANTSEFNANHNYAGTQKFDIKGNSYRKNDFYNTQNDYDRNIEYKKVSNNAPQTSESSYDNRNIGSQTYGNGFQNNYAPESGRGNHQASTNSNLGAFDSSLQKDKVVTNLNGLTKSGDYAGYDSYDRSKVRTPIQKQQTTQFDQNDALKQNILNSPMNYEKFQYPPNIDTALNAFESFNLDSDHGSLKEVLRFDLKLPDFKPPAFNSRDLDNFNSPKLTSPKHYSISPRKQAFMRYKNSDEQLNYSLNEVKNKLKNNNLKDVISNADLNLDEKVTLFKYKSAKIMVYDDKVLDTNYKSTGSLLTHGEFEIFQLHNGDVTYLSCGKTFIYPLLPKVRILRVSFNQFILPLQYPERYWKIFINSDEPHVMDVCENTFQRAVQYSKSYTNEKASPVKDSFLLPGFSISSELPPSPPSAPISPHNINEFASDKLPEISSIPLQQIQQPKPKRAVHRRIKSENSDDSMDSLLDEYEENIIYSTAQSRVQSRAQSRVQSRKPSISSRQYEEFPSTSLSEYKNKLQLNPYQKNTKNSIRSRRSSRSELYAAETDWMEPNVIPRTKSTYSLASAPNPELNSTFKNIYRSISYRNLRPYIDDDVTSVKSQRLPAHPSKTRNNNARNLYTNRVPQAALPNVKLDSTEIFKLISANKTPNKPPPSTNSSRGFTSRLFGW